MQESQKRTLVTALAVVAVILVVYFVFFRGGDSSLPQGDLPSGEAMSEYLAESGATTPEPSKPAAEEPEEPAGEGIGVAAGVGAGSAGDSGGATIGAASGVGSVPSAPSEVADESEVETPPSLLASKPEISVSEKLLEFKNLDPGQIILDKYEDLESKISEPEAFADDIGRVDPLTIVLDFIPEELRPPRTGETNEEEILKFIEETSLYSLIDSVDIRIDEVLEMGSYTLVLLTINAPFLDQPISMSVREGGRIGGGGFTISVTDASQTRVVCVISVQGRYTTVSKTRTFISRSY